MSRTLPSLRIRFAGPVVLLAAVAFGQEGSAARPVPPKDEYLRRKELMAELLMPNYKATWAAIKANDGKSAGQAVRFLAAGAKKIGAFAVPENGGSPEDFRKRSEELAKKADSLEKELESLSGDRSAIASRVMAIYQVCQGCHEKYAPAEGAERRKYSPPL